MLAEQILARLALDAYAANRVNCHDCERTCSHTRGLNLDMHPDISRSMLHGSAEENNIASTDSSPRIFGLNGYSHADHTRKHVTNGLQHILCGRSRTDQSCIQRERLQLMEVLGGQVLHQ
jgi:hypothetical protein